MQQYDKAQTLILDRLEKFKQGNYLVDLGYNFQLQKKDLEAKKNYNLAIERIKKNSDEVYSIAQTFEQKALFDYALLAYQTALSINSKYQFNYQMAVLYGQKGDVTKMIDTFLDDAIQNPINTIRTQNQLSRFMNDDKSLAFNDLLRKALLIRIQKSQDVFWNDFLSWYYVQLKEYGKAFVQEKAIYKRNPESFSSIVQLGQLAMDEKDVEAATEILSFVLQNTNDLDLQIQANSYLVDAKIKSAKPVDYTKINQELDDLIKKFGVSPYSISLLQLKAHFAAFNLKDRRRGT